MKKIIIAMAALAAAFTTFSCDKDQLSGNDTDGYEVDPYNCVWERYCAHAVRLSMANMMNTTTIMWQGGMKSLWSFMRDRLLQSAIRCPLENFGCFEHSGYSF